MHKRNLLVMLLLSLSCSLVHSQQAARTISTELRNTVYELLTYQCGAQEVEDRFRLQISKLGQDIQPLLVAVLSDGLPDDARRSAQVQAERRFDRRQVWLTENGEELFGDDAERLAGRSKEKYVADAVRRVDVQFRENATRGLGVIGNADAAKAIEAALAQDPSLAILAEIALQEISERD